jgi:hypothetical protein
VETHVIDLTDLLYFEDLCEVNLVLHSYAGVLAGPVVERVVDRISSVTFLGAFIVEDGQSLLDVEPPEVRARYLELAAEAGHPGRRLVSRPMGRARRPATDRRTATDRFPTSLCH